MIHVPVPPCACMGSFPFDHSLPSQALLPQPVLAARLIQRMGRKGHAHIALTSHQCPGLGRDVKPGPATAHSPTHCWGDAVQARRATSNPF